MATPVTAKPVTGVQSAGISVPKLGCLQWLQLGLASRRHSGANKEAAAALPLDHAMPAAVYHTLSAGDSRS